MTADRGHNGTYSREQFVAKLRRVTDRTRNVLDLAHSIAQTHGHAAVLPEHILLGLLREGEGVAATALVYTHVSVDALGRDLEQHFAVPRTPEPVSPEPEWGPEAARVLERASLEAKELGHSYLGTEHVLLSLFSDTSSVTAQTLARHGAREEDVRREVARLLYGTP